MKLIDTFILIFFIFFFNNITCYHDLDYFALKYGTDKSSRGHNYAPIYEKHFSCLREKQITLLEIGLEKGKSARMWNDYFMYADLYFIDLSPKHVANGKKILSERSHCFVAHQGEEKELIDFLEKVDTTFDIIIDDGGHNSKYQIISFETLFPYVKQGGIYIIEDLQYGYWNGVGGSGNKKNPKAAPGSIIFYLRNLIDELNYIGGTNSCNNIQRYPEVMRNKLNYYQANIKAIHFHPGLCLIFKR